MYELMAMLTAQGCNLERVGGGGTLTPEMVAASMTNLNQDAYLYGLYRFCADQTVKDELLERHYVDTVNLALRGGWKLSKSEDTATLGRLSDFALEFSVKPSICLSCNGAGMLNNKGECPVCNGTGNGKDVSIRKIGARLKVTKHRAEFFWRDKLNILVGRHLQWEMDILDALKKLTSDKK